MTDIIDRWYFCVFQRWSLHSPRPTPGHQEPLKRLRDFSTGTRATSKQIESHRPGFKLTNVSGEKTTLKGSLNICGGLLSALVTITCTHCVSPITESEVNHQSTRGVWGVSR